MKKWLLRGWIAFIVISLLSMSSCGMFTSDKNKESGALGNSVSQQKNTKHTPPTMDEMIEAYRDAAKAYEYIEVSPLPLHSKPVTVDGFRYYQVSVDGMETLADLTEYLKCYFSDGIVTGLLNQDTAPYRDIDGKLYGLNGGRGKNIALGKEQYSYSERSGTEVVLEVTVENLDEEDLETVTGHTTHNFVYEKTDDQWVFTEFPYFR